VENNFARTFPRFISLVISLVGGGAEN